MDYVGFDIYEQVKPINTDLTVTFNPDNYYSSYKLIIYKDDSIYKELNKISLTATTFTLSETGIYRVDVIYNDESIISSGTYIIDKEAPTLAVGDKYIEMRLGSKLDVMGDVIVHDNISFDLQVTTNVSDIDFNTKGLKKLIYTVSDEAGNMSSSEVTIKVLDSNVGVLILQSCFIVLFIIVILGIMIYNKSVKLENRITRFCITPLHDNSISLFDRINLNISKMIKNIDNLLFKSEFIKKYSKRYYKYLSGISELNQSCLDFVSLKVICAFLCLVIALFSKTIRLQVFNIYNSYLPLLVGFFIPDVIYHFKYKAYKRKMENDLLQAIIIMNNAFKSGRSIVQAIDLVACELSGPMAREFRKMHLELSFGLGIDVVFSRFSKRIKVEEAAYLTASLTILNKSGGNIIEVFSSIEKSLFNKKKLRLELSALTSGSRMIVNILMIVPVLFMLLIYIINPSYFLPLFTNFVGYIIMVLVLIYYIAYIIVVRKALKVKI